MKIESTTHGNVIINLDGNEMATAIDAYLVSHCVCVSGPRTIRVNGTIIKDVEGKVIVNGSVIADGERIEAHWQGWLE